MSITRRVLLTLHALGALAVLTLCLGAALESMSYFGIEPFAFTYGRSLPALLCGLFAACQLYLTLSKRLTLPAALLFYPLCLALGVVAELAARSSAKAWPVTSTGNVFADIVSYGLLIALATICSISCYRSYAHGRSASS